jgi:hypothetical protein
MLSSLAEHLFKELKLCVCGRHEEERDVEKGGEYSCHSGVRVQLDQLLEGQEREGFLSSLPAALYLGKVLNCETL